MASEDKKKERVLDNSAVEAKDNLELEAFMRGFKVVDLPKKSNLRKVFGIEKIRIYDRSLSPISTAGDDAFAYELARLLDEGKLKTRDEMLAVLKKRGVWSDVHDKKITDLSAALDDAIEYRDDLHLQFDKMKEDQTGRDGVEKGLKTANLTVIELIENLNELAATQLNFFKDTIEFRSRTIQKVAWIACSVCRDEGDDKYHEQYRLWKDAESFSIDSRIRNTDIAWLGGEADKFWALANEENERFFAELDEEQT